MYQRISVGLVLWLIILITLVNSDQATPPKEPTIESAIQTPTPATPPKFPTQVVVQDERYIPYNDVNEYKGKEYRFKRFVIRPGQLKLEACLIVVLTIYVIQSYRGKNKNERIVQRWLKENSPLLQKEFSHLSNDINGYISDGPTRFYTYATGRKNCFSLTISFLLKPRQDLPFLLYQFIRAVTFDLSWSPSHDQIEFIWYISNNPNFEFKHSFVWALVNKTLMNSIREHRWDLRTFTEVKESNQLPSQLVYMTESGEISEQMIKNKEIGIIQFFQNNPSCLKWFDSLILSGLPEEEPSISQLPLGTVPIERTLTVRLRLPSADQSGNKETTTSRMIQLSMNLIDALVSTSSVTLSPMTISKLVKKRKQVSYNLLEYQRKLDDESSKLEDETRSRRRNKLDDEKIKSAPLLSPTEQRKLDEKLRKKKLNKMRSKATVKRK